MRTVFVIFICFCIAGLVACKPENNAKAPLDPVIAPVSLVDAQAGVNAERLMTHIQELSSDAFGGRDPMSEGERLTLEFIEKRFREMGLDPLFGESYRQAVDLVAIEADPATVQMTFHMDGTDRLVTYQDEMVAGSKRMVPESQVEGSEVVFVGYGIVAPEFGWNDYADVDVKGKTVLILINDPGFASQDPALFRGNAMTYYGRWTYKFEEAARQGVAAAIIIHDTAPAAYGWEVVRNSWTGPQFSLHKDNDNMDRPAIESWIQRNVAEELVEASGLQLTELEQAAITPEFKAVELNSTMDARVENRIMRSKSYNIGAVLPGSSRPEETFIYTAHWDHLGQDLTVAEGEDGIFNGAVDNATGVSALLELGYSFSSLPRAPARSIAFLAVTAEESGLLGSAYYADNPAVPMHDMVGGINIDALMVYGPTNDIVVVGYGSSELEDILIRKAGEQGRVIKPEQHPERGGYFRSDHFNLARKGVPMLYAKGGSDHRELGPDYIPGKSQEYLKTRYHSVRDEVNEDWDLRGAIDDISVFFRIGLEVADSELWPEWYEGNEFRLIRERSLQSP